MTQLLSITYTCRHVANTVTVEVPEGMDMKLAKSQLISLITESFENDPDLTIINTMFHSL